MSKFSVQGFLKNRRYKKVESTTINTNDYFDGLMLDEMQLNVTINTEKDVDDLELYLKWIRPCFRKGEKREDMEDWIKENIGELKEHGDNTFVGKWKGYEVLLTKITSRQLRLHPLNYSVDLGNGCGSSITIDF